MKQMQLRRAIKKLPRFKKPEKQDNEIKNAMGSVLEPTVEDVDDDSFVQIRPNKIYQEDLKDSNRTFASVKTNKTSRSTMRKNRKPCMFYPEDGFMQTWRFFITILLFFVCFYTPWEIAFFANTSKFSVFVDCMFLLDMIFTFNYAFEDHLFNTIDDRKKIALNYLKGWFLIDFIALVPYEVVLLEEKMEG